MRSIARIRFSYVAFSKAPNPAPFEQPTPASDSSESRWQSIERIAAAELFHHRGRRCVKHGTGRDEEAAKTPQLN
jgi:hypothetical protein